MTRRVKTTELFCPADLGTAGGRRLRGLHLLSSSPALKSRMRTEAFAARLKVAIEWATSAGLGRETGDLFCRTVLERVLWTFGFRYEGL